MSNTAVIAAECMLGQGIVMAAEGRITYVDKNSTTVPPPRFLWQDDYVKVEPIGRSLLVGFHGNVKTWEMILAQLRAQIPNTLEHLRLREATEIAKRVSSEAFLQEMERLKIAKPLFTQQKREEAAKRMTTGIVLAGLLPVVAGGQRKSVIRCVNTDGSVYEWGGGQSRQQGYCQIAGSGWPHMEPHISDWNWDVSLDEAGNAVAKALHAAITGDWACCGGKAIVYQMGLSPNDPDETVVVRRPYETNDVSYVRGELIKQPGRPPNYDFV